MKALDLKDSYKLIPTNHKTIWPSIAEALDSVPSGLFTSQQAQSGVLTQYVIDLFRSCALKKDGRYCYTFDYVDGITGKNGSPQNPSTAISETFRSALVHLKFNYMMPEDRKKLF